MSLLGRHHACALGHATRETDHVLPGCALGGALPSSAAAETGLQPLQLIDDLVFPGTESPQRPQGVCKTRVNIRFLSVCAFLLPSHVDH